MIQEVLQGCGTFDLTWAVLPPPAVLTALGDGPTLLVFPGPVDADNLTDTNARATALYEGYVTTLSTSGISGWESQWLLQKPNGGGLAFTAQNGNTITNVGSTVTAALFTDAGADASVHGFSAGTTAGAVTSFTAIDGVTAIASSTAALGVRAWLDSFTNQLSWEEGATYAWSVTPGLKINVDLATNLFNQTTVAFTEHPTAEHGGEAQNIPSTIASSRSIETFAANAAYIDFDSGNYQAAWTIPPPDTVLGPNGSDNLAMYGIMQNPDKTDATLDQNYLQAFMDTKGIRHAATIESSIPNIRQHVGPGDLTYVHSNQGWASDTANSITHFGTTLHPMKHYVAEMMWEPAGSIVARTSAGVFVDLTDYVAYSEPLARFITSDLWTPAWRRRDGVFPDRLGPNGGQLTESINVTGGGFVRSITPSGLAPAVRL